MAKAHDSGSGIGGFVVGALLGAAAALLLTPKRGDEWRDEITREAEKLKHQSADLLETSKTKVSEATREAQVHLEELKGRAQSTIGHLGDEAHKAGEEIVDRGPQWAADAEESLDEAKVAAKEAADQALAEADRNPHSL